MDTQQFRYFLQLCVDKNYAAAADNLYITQQALRKSIKRLETETKCMLFYRSGDSLELTKAGVCVKSHARNIIDELHRMDTALAQLSDNGTSVIMIAASYGVYPIIASKLIIPFERIHPEVTIKIVELPDMDCEDAIKNGDADVGFCIGPCNTQYFDVHELESRSLCALVNKSNPLAARDQLTVPDLEGQPIAIVNEGFKIHHNFLGYCGKEGIKPEVKLEGGDVVSVHNFARFGQNIAVSVDFLGEDLGFNEVNVIPLLGPGLAWTVNSIVSKRVRRSDAADAFIKFIHDVYR
ncbi:MAG: LysR family transcriptional regulator [Coriobacteriales bacterium]|jgi:DNA-binding transcriptional LysR family regulator